MKSAVRSLGTIVLTCLPMVAMAQEAEKYEEARLQLIQTSARIERAIKTGESRWALKRTRELSRGIHQDWRSGSREITLSIYVYDDSKEASQMLLKHARLSPVSGEEVLEGFGDEAFTVTHRYFSWVLVRRDRTLVIVHGPPDLNLTKRFARRALEQVGGSKALLRSSERAPTAN